LTELGQYIGMISRRRFLEQMSRPYGLELFLFRPLRSLHRFASSEVLMVPRDMLIVEAAHQSLQHTDSSVIPDRPSVDMDFLNLESKLKELSL